MMRKIILLYIIIFFFSCSKKDTRENIPAQTITNIQYGTDARQKLGIYLPAHRNSTDTKLMVLIHGGSWSEGDKADFTPFIADLQRRFPDYAFANINYRLANGGNNLFPTQENDVKAALEFLFTKTADYKISNGFVLMGASAGGHLALLYSYKYSSPLKIRAVISLFGPTELVSLYNNHSSPALPVLLFSVTGATPATNLSLYQESSPNFFVTSSSCPTMLLHGGADPVVPASQSEILNDELSARGVPHEYVFYPSEGHGWIGSSLTDTYNRIEIFLKQQVK